MMRVLWSITNKARRIINNFKLLRELPKDETLKFLEWLLGLTLLL